MEIAGLALSVAVAYLGAAAFLPALALDAGRRTAVLIALYVPILLSPLLVPADATLTRLVASLNTVALAVKLYDLHVHVRRRQPPDWWTFLAYLPNWASIVLRKADQEPQPPARVNICRLAWGIIAVAAGCAALDGLFHVEWYGRAFALEHSAKVAALYVTVSAAGAVFVALCRLTGGRARDFMDRPAFARTPADFWRRHNRPVQQFFYEDIFKPAGGLRSPIRATLYTFVVSALIHEYVFGIAAGRVQGVQTAFFLLQGCAVAMTLCVRPKGVVAVTWTVGTLLFNLATGMLFFVSVNAVVPFYAGALDPWMGAWRSTGPG